MRPSRSQAPMTAKLSVEVDDGSLIVTMPGTCFRATYSIAAGAPTLTQSKTLMIDASAGIAPRDFEQVAWEVAYAKSGI